VGCARACGLCPPHLLRCGALAGSVSTVMKYLLLCPRPISFFRLGIVPAHQLSGPSATRRGVPRKLRIEHAGAMYHVMSPGDQREAIFKDHEDRQRFLATLGGGLPKDRVAGARLFRASGAQVSRSESSPLRVAGFHCRSSADQPDCLLRPLKYMECLAAQTKKSNCIATL